jgi:hypothetical protein
MSLSYLVLSQNFIYILPIAAAVLYQTVRLVASAAAPIDVNAPGLQSQLHDSSTGARVEFVSLVAQEEAEAALAARRYCNSLETAIELD